MPHSEWECAPVQGPGTLKWSIQIYSSKARQCYVFNTDQCYNQFCSRLHCCKTVQYVTTGIPEYEGVCDQSEIKNWPSVEEFKNEVDKFVNKHRSEGAIEGPCKSGIEIVKTSLIGAFIKKDKSKGGIIRFILSKG